MSTVESELELQQLDVQEIEALLDEQRDVVVQLEQRLEQPDAPPEIEQQLADARERLSELAQQLAQLNVEPPAAPPPPPPTDVELDERADKLGKAAKSYATKVSMILGDDLSGWIPCELCAPYAPGLRLPVEVDDATKEALRVIIGLPGMANYQQDKYSTTCSDCGGQGRVLTGSQVSGQSTVQCFTCKGKGWVPVGEERLHAVDLPPTPLDVEQVEEVALPAGAMPPAALAALRATVEAAERAAAGG